MDASDVTLLERWDRFRDAEAFAALVTRHASMVYAVCLRVLGNEEEAKDAAQECFAALMQAGPKHHRDQTGIGGWLHTVATRQALNRRRTEARRLARETRWADRRSEATTSPVDDVQCLVDTAIAELPPQLRGPLVAHFLEGRSHQSIADASGLPRQTVTNRIARGIEEVRRRLKARGVSITASALASVLTVESTSAAPAALTASLGRLALAEGSGMATGTVAGILGGTMAAKTGWVVGIVALIVALGAWFALPEHAGTSAKPLPSALPAAPASPPPRLAYRVESLEPQEVSRTAGPEASVAGRIVDSEDRPVSGAQVAARVLEQSTFKDLSVQDPVAVASSDASGAYTLSSLPMGKLLAVVVTASDWAVGGGNLAALAEGEARKGVDFKLRRPVNVTGTVVTDEGTPVAGARVFVLQARDRAQFEPGTAALPEDLLNLGGWGSPCPLAAAESDERGCFTLTGLPENAVLGRVGAEKEGYVTGWAVNADAVRHAVQTNNFKWSALDLELPCGELRIVLEPGGAVAGRVVRAGTQVPVPDAAVHVEGQRPLLGPLDDAIVMYGKTVQTNAQGAFTVSGVPPVEVNVFAEKQDERSGSVRVSVSRDLTTNPILLELSPVGALEGCVYDEATKAPIPNLMLNYSQREYSALLVAKTDDRGVFRLEGLNAGPIQIGPRTDSVYRLSTQRYPETVSQGIWTRIEIPIAPGRITKDVKLYCESRPDPLAQCAVVRGKVVRPSGEGAAGAGVSVEGGGAAQAANAEGRYELTCVKPGRHTLWAVDEASGRYGTAEVTVEAGKEAQADIRLASAAGKIAGRLSYRNGSPSSTSLTVIGLDPPAFISVAPKLDGTFEAFLVPGRYAVSPAAEGARWVSTPPQRDVAVHEGETIADVDFVLEAMQGSVAGSVAYEDGTPAASLTVIVRGPGVAARALTDASGNFVVHPIDGDNLSVDVMNPEHEGLVYASVSPVSSGQDDVRVVLEKAGELTGTLVAPEEREVELSLLPLGEGGNSTSSTMHLLPGWMNLSLAPGRYSLRLVQGDAQFSTEVAVSPGAATDLGEIRLGK